MQHSLEKIMMSGLIVALLTLTSSIFSEEKYGIEVYPGGNLNETLTNLSQESADKMQEGLPPANRITFDQSVYTTQDNFDKVLAFYEGIFAMKAEPFDPENPSAFGPDGFSLLQEIDLKDAVNSAKVFNPDLDASAFEGTVQLALFNKPGLPMVSIMNKGLNWKDGSVINSTIISITNPPAAPTQGE